jgi:hypothetical protein
VEQRCNRSFAVQADSIELYTLCPRFEDQGLTVGCERLRNAILVLPRFSQALGRTSPVRLAC